MDKDLLEIYLKLNGIEQLSDFNSWEKVRKVREEIKKDKFTALTGLEHSWQMLSDDYNSQRANEKDLISRAADERLGRTPIEAFIAYISLGFYPPPEVMLAVKKCFDLYLQCSGEADLEEIFFGPRIKKKGNYASRESKGNLYFCFDAIIFWESKPSNKSLEEKADSFLTKNGIDKDVDSFLRGYRRWKKNNRSRNLPDK